MPHAALTRSPFFRRLSTVALAAILGTAALPAVDAAAASGGAKPSTQTIPGLHAVKTHFIAVKRRDVSVPKRDSRAADAVTASDGTTASLVPAPPGGPVRSTWVVNYDAGFTTASNGPAAQAAFQAAVDIWSHVVYSPVPIVVNASYANLGGNVLGQAAAYTGYYCGCIGDGVHVYPVALANALHGSDFDSSHPDIVAQFNSSPVAPFYYGTDGAPTSGTVDFESVVLHELGHGLGFAGSMSIVSPATTVSYSAPAMKWDTFLQSGTGTSMLSYASGSSELTTAMESPLYWNGSNGISANGGTDPAMYAPATWQQGSSGGAHLDESAYPLGNAYSLMTPSIRAQEAVHSPGAVAVAMFRDIGWTASLPTGVPAAPTGVTGTRGDTSATVSWTASNDYGSAVTQYVATASPGGATCSTTGALSCQITGLTNGTSYTFTAKATNAYGAGAASSASSAVVPAGTPGTPAAPTASPNNGGATVSWTAPSNNGASITGYDVESSADNGTTWSAGLASALTSTATQATFTGLSSGTSYVFRVAAINGVGEGTASPASSAITPAQTPAAPTAVQTTRGDTQVAVSWTAPGNVGDGPITGYRLEWSSDGGTTWSSPLTSALTSTAASAAVTGLTNGTPYVFHVAAINSLGTGAFSTQSSAATPAGLPGAPSNVGGTPGNAKVTVTWTAPSNNGDAITGYDVESSTNGTTWSSPVASALTSTATSAVVSSLTNGQAYYFRVAAINTVGTGTPAAAAGTVTPVGTPAAPTNVSATRGASQAAIVSWTAPSDNGGSAITSYVVRMSTDSGAHWTTLGTTTGSPVNITSLTNGTSYVFDVAAINSIGAGTYSAASNAVVPATAPGAPTQVSGAAGDGQVSLTWTAPSSNGGAAVTGYTVEWSSDNGTTWSSPLASAQSSATAAALVTGLTNGTSYVFRVAAINGVGTGTFSTNSAAVTPAGAPPAPTGVSATAADHQATVTFTVPSSNGGSAITSYDVRYSVDGGNSWDSAGVAYTGSPAVVTGLFNGAPYLFEVAAINAIGTSGYSAPSSAVVPSGLPAAPTSVSASAGDTQATVTWRAPSANGSAITGYVVRFSSDSGAHWTPGNYAASPATVTSLTNGTPYVFEVATVNGVGTGAYSAPTTAVTPATTPSAPADVSATAGDTQATVTWTVPANGGATISSYDVRYSADNGTTWTSAGSYVSTPATVTGLTNGTSYVFDVAASNSAGQGAYSAASSAITPVGVPSAPTNVSGSRGDTQVTVSWAPGSSNGSAVTGYDVRYSADNGTTWRSAGTFESSPATVTGLTNGTSYVFDVAATNGAGTGAYSTSSAAVVPATTPGTPANLVVTAGNTQASLSWSAPSSDGGSAVFAYNVQWSSNNGTTWSGHGVTSTSDLITGLTNGTAYVFRVSATNSVGAGSYTATSAPVTPATKPSVPMGVGATAGDQQATVNWTTPSNGGSAITSYDVRYSSDSGATWTSAGIAYAGSPATVTGLTNGTSYLFEVAAINAIGTSGYSTPSAAVSPAGVAGAPAAVSATAGDTQATVTWTAPAANGTPITGYDVRYSSDSGATWTSAGDPYAGSPASVTGLANGTSYVFDVAAIDANGTGAYSASSAAVTPSTTPGVPAFVTLSRGDSQVSLTWSSGGNGGSAITGYDVEWTSDNGTTWSSPLSSATTSPATSATVTGLANGTTYKFQIAAVNANGPGSFSTVSNGVTPAAVPGAPTAVSGTRGDTSVSVSWTAPSANGAVITSYQVRYSTDNGTSWTTAGTGYGNSPVTVTGLTNGTSYVFDVAASNLIGQGAYSAVSDAVVPATAPDIPASVAGSPDNGQVSLTWTAPSSDGGLAISGYDVEWSGDNGTTWSSPLASAQSSDATAAIVAGLTNGTAYLFRVDAINAAGTGAWSDPSAAVTPATVPGVPGSVSAVGHDQSATVTWQSPVNGGATISSYDVRYSADNGTTWTSAGVAYAGSPASVTGLTNGTSYLFEVAAINSAGSGDYSSPTMAIVPAGVPVAPTAVSATRGDAQAIVSWTDGSANGSSITGYDVRYSSDNGTTWTTGTYASSPATVGSLANGTSYVFEVDAINGAGTSAYSAMSDPVTPATIPDVPADVAGTSGPGEVSVTWTAGAAGGSPVTGYSVRYSADDGATWTTADSAFAGSPALISGLTNGTAYLFEVAAANTIGSSDYSAPSAAITPAASPDAATDLAATRDNGQAVLSWTEPAANGTAITSYVVEYTTDDGAHWTTLADSFAGSPATVTGLTNGTAYKFAVAAANAAGTGAFSNVSNAVTPATTPATPTGVSGSHDGAGFIAVAWTAPADGGDPITGYDVEWSADGVNWSAPLDSAAASTATTAVVSGLDAATAYVFRVAAINGLGTGEFSASSASIMTAAPPAAPAIGSAVAGDSEVKLSWSAPADNGGAAISSYVVRYSTDGGTTWTANPTAFTGSSATVTDLVNGTSYVFEVAAVNDAGLGDYSAPSTVAKPWRDSSSLSHGSPATIAYSRSLVVGTILRDTTTGNPLVAYSVQLMSRPNTSSAWSIVRTVSTSWTGNASVTVKPSALTLYAWKFAGTPGHAATMSSTQTVSVSQGVGIATTATSIRHGYYVKYFGIVGPNETGQYVYLQVLVGRTWKTTALKAKLVSQRLPNGVTRVGYVLALKTASIGTFYYRVYRPATTVNLLGVSKSMALKVT